MTLGLNQLKPQLTLILVKWKLGPFRLGVCGFGNHLFFRSVKVAAIMISRFKMSTKRFGRYFDQKIKKSSFS